ncbi:hypothetical protein DPMN_009599 [Dreissena polymorpha]|uniref:Uncharacterized protein n=1 Tax=Dreissena polymorpha TaxID=45954 RepID=A0A9D4N1K1_DREPO|nr:hypothetical protein DPMN_009599 [Dreissena polymorpha]
MDIFCRTSVGVRKRSLNFPVLCDIFLMQIVQETLLDTTSPSPSLVDPSST